MKGEKRKNFFKPFSALRQLLAWEIAGLPWVTLFAGPRWVACPVFCWI